MNITPEQALKRIARRAKDLRDVAANYARIEQFDRAQDRDIEADAIDWALARIAELEAREQQTATQSVCLAASRVGRVYLAGPMTGVADWNFPAFNAEAARLRSQGLHVENPADHGLVDGAEWADYLRYDLGRLATCEALHLLPGWSASRGAKLEVMIARALGMQITFADGSEAREAADCEPVEVVAHLLIDDPTGDESGDWDIEPVASACDRLAAQGAGRYQLMAVAQHKRIVKQLTGGKGDE